MLLPILAFDFQHHIIATNQADNTIRKTPPDNALVVIKNHKT